MLPPTRPDPCCGSLARGGRSPVGRLDKPGRTPSDTSDEGGEG